MGDLEGDGSSGGAGMEVRAGPRRHGNVVRAAARRPFAAAEAGRRRRECAMSELEVGATGSAELVVGSGDLASSLSSDSSDAFPPVLVTARMIALMEVAGARVLRPLLQPLRLRGCGARRGRRDRPAPPYELTTQGSRRAPPRVPSPTPRGSCSRRSGRTRPESRRRERGRDVCGSPSCEGPSPRGSRRLR